MKSNSIHTQIFIDQNLQLLLDWSQMGVSDQDLAQYEERFQNALQDMNDLEKGELVNRDEQRMVGHYWLRNAELAPNPEIQKKIQHELQSVKNFVESVHSGKILSSSGKKFQTVLHIGIGGSALGPQLIASVCGGESSLQYVFSDNTDPEGITSVLSKIADLEATLFIVVSKSGSTREILNSQKLSEEFCKNQGIDFCRNAVAVTQPGSVLDICAKKSWLQTFAIEEWVGGRTSISSPVGLLPLALMGGDINSFLKGLRLMDNQTRSKNLKENPAGILASCWYHATQGNADRTMAVIPYRDRLDLFVRYLQQLVMESLGKKNDRDGKTAHQGLVVYGSKGSTAQHAYVQQLRDGPDNCFVMFLQSLKDRVFQEFHEVSKFPVENHHTAGDYLFGFLLGTRRALSDVRRKNITLLVSELSEYTLGAIIALFERAVGFYASFTHVNAYDQPGVEAGKKAAFSILRLQQEVLQTLSKSKKALSVKDIIGTIEGEENEVFLLLQYLEVNGYVERVKGDTGLYRIKE